MSSQRSPSMNFKPAVWGWHTKSTPTFHFCSTMLVWLKLYVFAPATRMPEVWGVTLYDAVGPGVWTSTLASQFSSQSASTTARAFSGKMAKALSPSIRFTSNSAESEAECGSSLILDWSSSCAHREPLALFRGRLPCAFFPGSDALHQNLGGNSLLFFEQNDG